MSLFHRTLLALSLLGALALDTPDLSASPDAPIVDAPTVDAPTVDVAGVWEGPIVHPDPDFTGTLTIRLAQNGTRLTGDATWQAIENGPLTGSLVGRITSSGAVTFTVDYGSGLSEVTHTTAFRHGGDALKGTWTASGLNGRVAIAR